MIPSGHDLKKMLPSFYDNYSFSEEDISFFLNLYSRTGDMLEEYIAEAKDMSLVSDLGVYRKVPIKIIPLKEAAYNIGDLLFDKDVSAEMGFSLADSLQKRTALWLAAPLRDKVAVLDTRRLYVRLSARRQIDIREPIISSIDLYTVKEVSLIRDFDYTFLDNKLYLFTSRALSVPEQKVIGRNIYIDFSLAESRYGSAMGLFSSGAVSKPAYRDFVQMAIFAALGGPTLANIKRAFDALAGWENVQLIDMFSADDTQAQFWQSNIDPASLTPFDFIIRIPAEQSKDEDRLVIFDNFLKIIKPIYTNYVIAWGHDFSDRLNQGADSNALTGVADNEDIITMFDEVETSTNQEDYYIMDIIGVDYENTATLNPPALDPVFAPQFPQFPLRFTATKNIITGNVDITFWDNEGEDVPAGVVDNTGFNRTFMNITPFSGRVSAGADVQPRYEVLRNGVIVSGLERSAEGTYAVISVVDTQFPSLPPGPYTYYARTVYEPNPFVPSETLISIPSATVVLTK